MALELAMEEVASAEEEGHPIFQRSCRRLSWGLLVLNVLQLPCFVAAAVFLKNPTGTYVRACGASLVGGFAERHTMHAYKMDL